MTTYNSKNLNENLSMLLIKTNTTISKLHKNTGVPLATIKRLQTDPKTNPTITSLLPISNFFKISLNQLIGIEKLPEKIGMCHENKITWTSIPIITWIDAVCWPVKKNELKYIETDCDVSEHGFALQVIEKDWIGILPNSILIVDPNLQAEHGDYVVTHKIGQTKSSFKQLIYDDDNSYLKSITPGFKVVNLDSNYKIIGVLVQIKNNLKNYI